MPPEKIRDYQQKAERIRARARETLDADARAQLLLVASLYDKLAKHLPIALKGQSPDASRAEDPPEQPDGASPVA